MGPFCLSRLLEFKSLQLFIQLIGSWANDARYHPNKSSKCGVYVSFCLSYRRTIPSCYTRRSNPPSHGSAFAGFRSVIGTMWELYDPDGPSLAREVYAYLLESDEGEVRYKRSVAALRNAVLKLKAQSGVQTERWVNMVHIGA